MTVIISRNMIFFLCVFKTLSLTICTTYQIYHISISEYFVCFAGRTCLPFRTHVQACVCINEKQRREKARQGRGSGEDEDDDDVIITFDPFRGKCVCHWTRGCCSVCNVRVRYSPTSKLRVRGLHCLCPLQPLSSMS